MGKDLSDNEAHDRLHAAREALGEEAGETVRGDTVLKAARRALSLLQFGLLKAAEDGTDKVEGIIDPPPDP
jgi:hypothetical protein